MKDNELSRRAFLRGLSGTLAVGLVAACAPAVQPPAQEAKTEEKAVEKAEEPKKGVKLPYEIVFWGHQYKPTDDVLEVILEEYEAANPGITIDYFVQRDAEFQQKSMPAIVAGGGPLIMEVMSQEWLIRMTKADALATVEYDVWGGKEAFEQYMDTRYLLDSRKVLGIDEDKWVPQGPGLTPGGIYINTKFADEDGFDWQKYQQESVLYDDIGPEFKVMSKFDDAGNITRDGFLLQHGYGAGRIYGYWRDYFYNLGGSLLNEDESEYLLDSPEGYQAMQWMRDLVFEHKASMLRPGVKESGSGIFPKLQTAATPYLGYWAFAKFKELNPEYYPYFRVLMQPKAADKPLKIQQGLAGRGQAVNARFSVEEQHEGWKLTKFIWDNGHRVSGIAGTDRFIRGDWPEWPALKDRIDADVYARNAEAYETYIAGEREMLTVAKRDDGFMRAFEDMMYNNVPVEDVVNTWNGEMNEALADL